MPDPREHLLAEMVARSDGALTVEQAKRGLAVFESLRTAAILAPDASTSLFRQIDIPLDSTFTKRPYEEPGEGLIWYAGQDDATAVDLWLNSPNGVDSYDLGKVGGHQGHFERFYVSNGVAQTGLTVRVLVLKRWTQVFESIVGSRQQINRAIINTESTTALAGAASVTGTTRDCRLYGEFAVSCYADVAGTLYVQNSLDGTTWRTVDTVPVPAATPVDRVYSRTRRYMRVTYTNGAAAQATFELATTRSPIGA